MDSCERLERCGFVKKYGEENDCKDMVDTYCRGKNQDLCKRKEYSLRFDCTPCDDMLPSGQIVTAKK